MTAREAVCWLLAVGAVLAPFLGSAPTAGSSPARARSARPGTRACRRTRPCYLEPDAEREVVGEVMYAAPDLLAQYLRRLHDQYPVVHVRRGTDRWYLEVTR